MKHNTTISEILQEIIREKEIMEMSEKQGYEDAARKATVATMYRYQLSGAIEKSESYRDLEIDGMKNGLLRTDYTTLSRKSKEIPYEIALELLEGTMERCNRTKRRQVTKEYNRFVRNFDTTRFIAKRKSWSWTPYEGDKNGIKVHVSYQPESGLPDRFSIGKINVGDTEHVEDFCKNGTESDCVLADRGYFNVAKFCHLDDAGQDFVIRIRNNTNLVNPISYDFTADSSYTDVLCTLGKDHSIPVKYRKRQFRVVTFIGSNGEKVTLCTNIYSLTADEIADLYKIRWKIETFFKTLKQNFSLKKIFGSTINAVFTQVIINFIAYIVLFSVSSIAFSNFSFVSFLRKIRADLIPFSQIVYLL